MINFINLTPHAVNIVKDGERVKTFEPSESVARVSQELTLVANVDGIDIFNNKFGEVIDLPSPKDDTLYIVSALVKSAMPERNDLVSPGALTRNESGQVIGCEGFIK